VKPLVVVLKFGGTCLQTPARRDMACERIRETLNKGYKVLAVVSAMGRTGEPYATDTLIGMAKGLHKAVAPRELDLLVSCGEIISAVLMVQELQSRGIPAMALSGGQAGIITDTNFGEAGITSVDATHVRRHLDEGKVVVVAGFQGRAPSGDITTLGRGGSDTTAAVLGAALDADYVEIYTDVEGIMTADPRVVKNAKTIPLATYDEVTQMAWEGAKIIHPRAVEIAHRAKTPVWVRSLEKDSKKTLVAGGEKQIDPWRYRENDRPVTGITYRADLVQILVHLPQGQEMETASRVFRLLRGVSLDLINMFLDRLSVVIPCEVEEETLSLLKPLDLSLDVRRKMAKVTAVGYGMHGKPGVMEKVISALWEEKIPVYASADSNITLSCLIDGDCLFRAVNAIHDAFGL
jgi:aspartate kinase